MNSQLKTIQDNETYGKGLAAIRGGWTLREMLGSEYESVRESMKKADSKLQAGQEKNSK